MVNDSSIIIAHPSALGVLVVSMFILVLVGYMYTAWHDNRVAKRYTAARKALLESVKPDSIWAEKSEMDNPWIDTDYLATVVEVKDKYLRYRRGNNENITTSPIDSFMYYYAPYKYLIKKD